MKKIKLTSLMTVLCLTAGLLSGCENKPEEESTSIDLRLSATLNSYCDAKGAGVQTQWAQGDKLALINADRESSRIYTSTPDVSNNATSSFLFQSVTASEEDAMMAWFPADAPVKTSAAHISMDIPSSQNGNVDIPVFLGSATVGKGGDMGKISLNAHFCTMYVSLGKGNYTAKNLTVEANGGECIAGTVDYDAHSMTATANSRKIELTLAEALDCTTGDHSVPVMIAPVSLSKGYKITVEAVDGSIHEVCNEDAVSLEMGGSFTTEKLKPNLLSEVVFCGSSMVYIVDAKKALAEGSYENAVIWSWDCRSTASITGISDTKTHNIDECKVVDDGKKILATCSNNKGWCILVDIESKSVDFYVKGVTNAHSAEYIDGKIVVAGSTGTDAIQVYDVNVNNTLKYSTPLSDAHAAVWNKATQRLYAVNYNTLQIYSLADWDSALPRLVPEKSISTPSGGSHDLTLVDDGTLCVSGHNAYLFDIRTETFTEMSLFHDRTAIKSVNYNKESGELWWTDSTEPEGTQTWSTQTICYGRDKDGSAAEASFKVPDLNVYKVRVRNW